MTLNISCFKAYDVRGKVPEEFNRDIAKRIGYATVIFLQAKTLVVGHDIRLSSLELTNAFIEGVTEAGADVIHIGLCGTEEVYFATFHLQADAGAMITASHNPINYNGLKLVGKESRPLSSDNGLNDIKNLAEQKYLSTQHSKKGKVITQTLAHDYTQHLLRYINLNQLKPLTIVTNAGNGGAGHLIDKLEPFLPFNFIKINHQADGRFPNGIPNPLLPENRQSTSNAVIKHKADLGIAWDGDFDRCFFFDEQGRFIEGYYIVGLLAQTFLEKYPQERIVHDSRLIWNTQSIISANDGIAIESKTGHAFMKATMRETNAIYGGEMSAHHYFRDFAYCDNGNIPWLLVTELVSQKQQKLSHLISGMGSNFPCSGEINNQVSNPNKVIQSIKRYYAQLNGDVSYVDGVSIDLSTWRFNLRMSNTEAVIRLNVESKNDIALMQEKTKEVLALIKQFDQQ